VEEKRVAVQFHIVAVYLVVDNLSQCTISSDLAIFFNVAIDRSLSQFRETSKVNSLSIETGHEMLTVYLTSNAKVK